MLNVLAILTFVLGFVLILKGGELLVDSAVLISYKTKISPLIIGATLVAITTTFPETAVVLLATRGGASDVSITTAIGAMVCNFTIVLGLSFLFMPTVVAPSSFLSKSLYFGFSIVLLFVLSLDGELGVVDAIILLINIAMFFVLNIFEIKKSGGNQIQEPIKLKSQKGWFKIIIDFLVGGFSIGIGAFALVDNIEIISKLLGLSEGIVGFVIIAIGTNIPELVTTISSIKQKNPEVGLGNIFGASILNSSLLMGIATFVSPMHIMQLENRLMLISTILLLFITFVIVFPILKNKCSKRWQGVVLLLTYVLYTILIF